MKYLIRGKANFLEAEIENGELKPAKKKVDPRTLVHFGTDIINCPNNLSFIDADYLKKLERMGVDYLFLSEPQRVDFINCGKDLRVVTAYKKA